ncbi:MAG: Beta-phosphoglucomutase [Verrucomicrobiae bacterium]|nr:Beta-phosphoglucomutase [Verrucomicrobiae bacterium]
MDKWAAIFDWDGVIIDSSRQHAASWERLAKSEKRTLPEGHFQKSFGMKNERIFPEVLKWTTDPAEIKRLAWVKEEHYRDIVRETGIEALPGVRTFLERLRDAGVPRVIGSSTPRENIDLVVKLVGLSDFFPEIVAAGDVTHGKPDPEVFLLGAKRLGFPAQRCVVFEDAHVGIEAARRAQMKVIGVATTHPAASIADADRVVHQLDELMPADCAELLVGEA